MWSEKPLKGLMLWSLLCAVVGVVAFQGTRGLYESTEGRYAECAREMLVSGDFLRPTLDFAPHWTKPPLTYWAIAAGVHIFGRHAWGARAYLIPTFILTVCAVYWLGRWMWQGEAGAASALVYASMWGPVGAAFTVNADSLLTLWETWALACFWWGVRTRRQFPIILMWLFLGLAFFTKGPPGLLPLLALVVFRVYTKGSEVRSARFWVPAGVGLGLVTALWWYLWAIAHYPGLLSYWLKHEVVGRVVTDEFGRHPHWYEMFTVYWRFLLGGSLPWLAVVLWVERHRLVSWYRTVAGQGFRTNLQVWAMFWRNLSIQGKFLTFTFWIPLAVFSLSRSRLPLYVLPLLPLISCAVGYKIKNFISQGRISQKRLVTLALAATVFIVFGKGVMAFWPSQRDMGALARALEAVWPEEKASPSIPLYTVSMSSLYGLQFYWGDSLIRVYPKADKVPPPGFHPLSILTTNRAPEPISHNQEKRVLTRRENVSKLVEYLQKEGYLADSRPLTRYWSVLEVKGVTEEKPWGSIGASEASPRSAMAF